ncbi:MAG TPA: PepSY domain-containing protein [Planctomycetota bacterium]|nr:PepSY domain-containing protein [Planctomycetota bacterium]
MTKTLILALGLLAFGCAQQRHEAKVDERGAPVANEDGDEAVPLDQVPDAARKAAESAVPGATFTGAEKEVEHGATVYSLEGTVDGNPCEVEVTADGKVTEIEKDGDDDHDRDDDDDKD